MIFWDWHGFMSNTYSTLIHLKIINLVRAIRESLISQRLRRCRGSAGSAVGDNAGGIPVTGPGLSATTA